MHPLSKIKRLFTKNNLSFYRFFTFITSKKGVLRIVNLPWRIVQSILLPKSKEKLSYDDWFQEHNLKKKDLKDYEVELKKLSYQPKISIVIRISESSELIKETFQSIFNQVYSNWEICCVYDSSLSKKDQNIILNFAKNDERIKVIFNENSLVISESYEMAFKILEGNYIAILDQDDLISNDALIEILHTLNENKEVDFIYSDEDVISSTGIHLKPLFKPDWSPDEFLSRNYIGHFVVVKSELLYSLENTTVAGDYYYDLLLKLTEKSAKIEHISKILYHARELKSVDLNDANKCIKAALKRRGIDAKVCPVQLDSITNCYNIHYAIKDFKKVSIIIPTKDKADITEDCIQSIFELTQYSNFEVLLMNNNSSEDSFFDMVERWKKKEPQRFICINDTDDFNFSRLMNSAVDKSSGDYILLLNNDTKVIHTGWLKAMVEQVQRKEVGAVGVKLIYEDETIQHAGVVIGIDGVAGHVFEGFNKDAAGYFDNIKVTKNYSAVTAACLMVRKESYNQVNGFDEGFAVSFNDVDFCLKLKEQGYQNIYLPHVTLYHYGSQSRAHPRLNKKNHKRHYEENVKFKEKWRKYIDYDPCYNSNLSLNFNDFRVKK